MTSLLSSQGVVLATAMVVSSTVLFLTFSKHVTFPQLSKHHDPDSPQPSLRPCLCTDEKAKKKSKNKKKKRVQFAKNVKDPKGNGEEYRRVMEIAILARQEMETARVEVARACREEIHEEGALDMPANRIALYNGILKDRLHRIECSY